jgi:hypothetical protein
MDKRGKFVDGDVGARVRDSGKGSRVVVWLKTDGGVESDAGGRGDVKRRSRGGRSGAANKRTGCQAKEVRVGMGRGGRKMSRDRDVFCADGVTTEESYGRGQGGVGRTERTAEEREERGHEMGGRGGAGQETLWLMSAILLSAL